MDNKGTTYAWAIALFVVGFLILNPPLIRIFSPVHGQLIFGFPVLFACIFIAWFVLIAAIFTLSCCLPRKVGTPQDNQKPGEK